MDYYDFEDWYDELCYLLRDMAEDPDKNEVYRDWEDGYSPEEVAKEIRENS